MAYDQAGLREEVQQKLQHHDRFTDDVVDLAVNRGIDEVVSFASANWDVSRSVVPADPTDATRAVFEYPLPSDLFYLKSVSYDGIPVNRTNQPGLVDTGLGFSTEIGAPRQYHIRGSFINFNPRPPLDNTKIVEIWYLKKTADLGSVSATGTDVPPLIRAYSAAIIFYACWWCVVGQPEEAARAEEFKANWLKTASDVRFRLSRNNVGRTRRVR